MNKLTTLIISLSMLTTVTTSAQMYKWVDANGQTHFSDKPHVSAKEIKVDGSGKVKVLKSSKNTKRSQQRSNNISSKSIRVNLTKLLKQKQFKQLNKTLERLDKSFKKNIKNEQTLFTAYQSFSIKKESFESLFNQWVKATPKSYIPYVARAKYFHAMAWKARGTKYSISTPEKQKYEMREYLERASSDLSEALSLNEQSIVIYEVLISMATTLGANDEAKNVLQTAIKMYPASFNLRKAFLVALIPRWGGSYAEMQEFVDETEEFVKLNPKLKLLESAIYIDKGQVLSLKSEYELASLMFNSSLGFGDYSEAFFVRGKNYVRLEQYKKAVTSLDKAIDLETESPLFFYWRAKAYIKLEQFDKAASDLKYAAALDPYDNSIRDKKRWLASKLSNVAYDVKGNGDSLSAIEKYTAAINFDPEDSNLYNNRARAYYDQRQHTLALKDIQKAIELEPENYNHRIYMDYLVFKSTRDWPLIIRSWNEYIELKPDDARAYAEVAGTYYHNKDLKTALRYAKKSADMGNNDGIEVYNRLKKL